MQEKLNVKGIQELVANYKNNIFTEKPFTVTFFDNEPYSNVFNFYPNAFHNTKIIMGDNYTFNYTFTSNIDLEILWVYFLDITEREEGFYTRISANIHLKRIIKANTEYNGSVTIIATNTAKSTNPNANLFGIETYYTQNQPTVTFSKFELVKVNCWL